MDLLMVSAVDLLRCVLALDHLLRTDLLAINPREFWVVFHVNFSFFPEIFFAINSFLNRRCGKLEHQGMDLLLKHGCGFEPTWVRMWAKWVRIWPQIGTDLTQNGCGFRPTRVRSWPKMSTEFRLFWYEFETELMGFGAKWDVNPICLTCAFGAAAGRQEYSCRARVLGGYWQ